MDDLLIGLYIFKAEHNGEGDSRISSLLPGNPYWRTIANEAFNQGFIEYAHPRSNTIAHITQAGIDYLKQKKII